MIERSQLPGPNLKDGTAPSQSGGSGGSLKGEEGRITAADLERGYQKLDVERTPIWSDDTTPGENQVGDPYTYGGFLGRPRGNAR